MRISTIVFLFSLIAAAFGGSSFTTCVTTDHLGISDVTLSENPVVPGTDLTVSVTGTPDEEVTSGTLKLSVSAYGITILTEQYDLCSGVGITCPLESGVQFVASVTEGIPSATPAVTATATLTAYDGSGNELSCVSMTVKVEKASSDSLSDEASEFLLRRQFEQYKSDFSKVYESAEEEELRFFHFTNAVERIAFKNAFGDNVFGLTKFSDMCPEEFKARYLNYKPAEPSKHIPVHRPSARATTSSYDWRDKNAVTPVKNQGYCGSCWAFSAVETVESAWYLAGNTLTEFSEQQVVSCDTTDAGCNGGNTVTAYEYIEKAGGLATESSYPYASSSGTAPSCTAFTVAGGDISGYSYATTPCSSLLCSNQDEDTLASNLASTQPVSICVDASSWSDYTGGVMTSSSCSSKYLKQDHCVQLVGYEGYTGTASSSTSGYWLVRNSWDTDWGEAGYIYLSMGDNTCGMANEATMVTIA